MYFLRLNFFSFALAHIPAPSLRPGVLDPQPLATLTLEVEVSTVGIGVALPVVLQAAVDGQLLWLTVHSVSYVMTFTFTLVLALWREWKG